MIVIPMTEDDPIQPRHAQRAQRRYDRALAGIETIAHRRPGVV